MMGIAADATISPVNGGGTLWFRGPGCSPVDAGNLPRAAGT